MKRFDLLRSPLLLLAVGVLLLNDFVLKAAFHNWLTGKLSDVAGLAAFTIFWCAIWPRHVWTVGGCIAVSFAFWKSPYSTDLIEAANAGLPFTIGRIVDYSDLLALPVVGLVCRNAHRLPLIDLGKIGVWLTAGVCLFAFTATSQVMYSYNGPTTAAEIPGPASPEVTEASLQQMLDEVAARYGLRCRHRCGPLSQGRLYASGGALMIAAGFDADQNRLLFDASASANSQDEVDRMRPEVDRVKAAMEQELRMRFPSVAIRAWTYPPFTTTVVRVALPSDGDAYDQALAAAEGVLRSTRLNVMRRADELSATSEEQVRVSPLSFASSLRSRSVPCRGSGSFVILVSSGSASATTLRRRMVEDLVAGFGRAFGRENVSATGAPSGPSIGCSG